MSAKTGIEISLDYTQGVQKLGKIFHTLHLDTLVVELLKKTRTLVVTLDGERHELAILEKHFLPCSPGPHSLELALAISPINLGINERLTHQATEITVEPGHITEIHFRQGMGPASYEIVLVGARPG